MYFNIILSYTSPFFGFTNQNAVCVAVAVERSDFLCVGE